MRLSHDLDTAKMNPLKYWLLFIIVWSLILITTALAKLWHWVRRNETCETCDGCGKLKRGVKHSCEGNFCPSCCAAAEDHP